MAKREALERELVLDLDAMVDIETYDGVNGVGWAIERSRPWD